MNRSCRGLSRWSVATDHEKILWSVSVLRIPRDFDNHPQTPQDLNHFKVQSEVRGLSFFALLLSSLAESRSSLEFSSEKSSRDISQTGSHRVQPSHFDTPGEHGAGNGPEGRQHLRNSLERLLRVKIDFIHSSADGAGARERMSRLRGFRKPNR